MIKSESIIPLLTVCANSENTGCARVGELSIEIINRQKVEIESLKQIIDEQDKEIIKLQKRIIFWRQDMNYQPEMIKSEAIKEFAERLKTRLHRDYNYSGKFAFETYLDNFVKEMTEGK